MRNGALDVRNGALDVQSVMMDIVTGAKPATAGIGTPTGGRSRSAIEMLNISGPSPSQVVTKTSEEELAVRTREYRPSEITVRIAT